MFETLKPYTIFDSEEVNRNRKNKQIAQPNYGYCRNSWCRKQTNMALSFQMHIITKTETQNNKEKIDQKQRSKKRELNRSIFELSW